MTDALIPTTGPTNGLDALLHPQRVGELSARRDIRQTGFDPLDGVLSGGFAPEELVIVGGRPGVGKSVALMQWSRNLAKAGRTVVMAYYEHSELMVLCQLLLIELGEAYAGPVETIDSRLVVDELIGGRLTWAEAIAADAQVAYAAQCVTAYAPHLRVLDQNGRRGGIESLSASLDDGADVLVVDHLQKVSEGTPGSTVGSAASSCKGLAVEYGVTVIAASVVQDAGIDARRLRMGLMVDAAAVAHEADIELVLNDKLPIVSRNHTAFDTVRAESFRNQVVFSIEKNRRGLNGVDIEFNRDFAHRRFAVNGAFVSEHLIDGVSVIE